MRLLTVRQFDQVPAGGSATLGLVMRRFFGMFVSQVPCDTSPEVRSASISTIR
jgi:hypothetical protein